MIDQDETDEKIIAVPYGDPTYNNYKSILGLPAHISEEIQHFFKVYKNLEHKEVQVLSMEGPEEAKKSIKAAFDLFEKTFGKEKK